MGHPGGGSHRAAAANTARLSGDYRHRRTSAGSRARRRLHGAVTSLRSRDLSRGVAVAVHGADVRRSDGLRARPQTRDAAARLSSARIQLRHRCRRGYKVRYHAGSFADGIRAGTERRTGKHARNFLRHGSPLESDLHPGSDLRAITTGALGIHAPRTRRPRRRCHRDDGAGSRRTAGSIRRNQELRSPRH